MGEQNKPQEGKPLTAEEMISKFSYYPECCNQEVIGVDDAEKIFTEYTAALREELEEIKQRNVDLEANNKKAWHDHEIMTNLADGLREELKEETIQKINGLMEIKDLKEELEAVKNERDQWQETYQNEHINLLEVTGQRDEAKREWQEMFDELKISIDQHNIMVKVADIGFSQRDEAVNKTVDLCREAFTAGMDLEESAGRGEDWKAFYDRALSRLSSGETKPVSPWISIEDRLPERPNTTHGRFSPRVWVGNPKQDAKLEESDNYDFELGRWHRYGSRVKFWMPISPLPASPESLTDKK